jgi:hypothetical protein
MAHNERTHRSINLSRLSRPSTHEIWLLLKSRIVKFVCQVHNDKFTDVMIIEMKWYQRDILKTRDHIFWWSHCAINTILEDWHNTTNQIQYQLIDCFANLVYADSPSNKIPDIQKACWKFQKKIQQTSKTTSTKIPRFVQFCSVLARVPQGFANPKGRWCSERSKNTNSHIHELIQKLEVVKAVDIPWFGLIQVQVIVNWQAILVHIFQISYYTQRKVLEASMIVQVHQGHESGWRKHPSTWSKWIQSSTENENNLQISKLKL